MDGHVCNSLKMRCKLVIRCTEIEVGKENKQTDYLFSFVAAATAAAADHSLQSHNLMNGR